MADLVRSHHHDFTDYLNMVITARCQTTEALNGKY